MKAIRTTVVGIAALMIVAGACLAATTTQPAKSAASKAEILKVTGKVVKHKLPGGEWQVTKKGDILTAGAEIRTGPMSEVLVRMNTTVDMVVKSYTRIAIAELSRGADSEKIHVFLNRGTVRANIIHEKIRSDFKIACPAAVLSREGTKGIEMTYDPTDGDYDVWLEIEGLVRVLDSVTGRQVGVRSGEYIRRNGKMWVRAEVLSRTVTLVDPFGVTQIEEILYADNPGGLIALNPTTGGNISAALGRPDLADSAVKDARDAEQMTPTQTPDGRIRTVRYRDGNFGTHINDSASKNKRRSYMRSRRR